jgi:hypothetical protein
VGAVWVTVEVTVWVTRELGSVTVVVEPGWVTLRVTVTVTVEDGAARFTDTRTAAARNLAQPSTPERTAAEAPPRV